MSLFSRSPSRSKLLLNLTLLLLCFLQPQRPRARDTLLRPSARRPPSPEREVLVHALPDTLVQRARPGARSVLQRPAAATVPVATVSGAAQEEGSAGLPRREQEAPAAVVRRRLPPARIRSARHVPPAAARHVSSARVRPAGNVPPAAGDVPAATDDGRSAAGYVVPLHSSPVSFCQALTLKSEILDRWWWWNGHGWNGYGSRCGSVGWYDDWKFVFRPLSSPSPSRLNLIICHPTAPDMISDNENDAYQVRSPSCPLSAQSFGKLTFAFARLPFAGRLP